MPLFWPGEEKVRAHHVCTCVFRDETQLQTMLDASKAREASLQDDLAAARDECLANTLYSDSDDDGDGAEQVRCISPTPCSNDAFALQALLVTASIATIVRDFFFCPCFSEQSPF